MDDQRIDTQAAARPVKGEHQLYDDEEKVGPRPFAMGRIEAQPQIDRHRRTDNPAEANRGTGDQRYADEYLGSVDYGREQQKIGLHDVLDEVALEREGRAVNHLADPIAQPAGAVGQVGVGRRKFPQGLLPPHATDEETQDIGHKVLDVALLGIAGKINPGDQQTRDDQKGEHIEQG